MKIAVIGAGGVGSVFGGRLATAGHDVWLVHRRSEMVDAVRRGALRLETPDSDERIALHGATETTEIGPVDLVLVLTKSTDTPAAAHAARALVADRTLVLTLQNGLGNLETIGQAVGAERTLLGMTYVGAVLVGPGHARLTAPGQTFIGEPSARGVSERVQHLARVFSDAGMPTEATDRLWEMVWGKLVINAALNATCALTGATGDTALGSEAAYEWLGKVAEETASVARAAGIALPYADAAARVRQHCRDVGRSKPSMLQDMERGRPTEIDAINGAVVREGARLGVPTPYNEALLMLVKAREQVAAQAGD